MDQSSLYPTTAASAVLVEAARFIKAKQEFTSGRGTKPGHEEFMTWLPVWLAGLEKVQKVPGVTIEAWAAYTLAELKRIVPADLEIVLEDFDDLGVVARQIIETSWKLAGTTLDENMGGRLLVGPWSAFKLQAVDKSHEITEPLIQAFAMPEEFQTPAFKIQTVEGGFIYLAQHDDLLTGSDIYRAAIAMVGGADEVQIDTLTSPVVDVKIRGRLPWMEGIIVGDYRLQYAHYFAHLTMDEKGSRDVQEVQAGFEKCAIERTNDFVIRGPMMYVREIGGVITSPYYLATDAYKK